MGTSGLQGLIIKGQRHGCQVNSDSYPSGLGNDLTRFICSLTDGELEELARLLEEEVTWVRVENLAPEDLQARYSTLRFDKRCIDSSCDRESFKYWDFLLYRLKGVRTLEQGLKGNLRHIEDGVEFGESIYGSDWEYWLDFRARTIQIRRAFTYARLGKVTFDVLRVKGLSYMQDLHDLFMYHSRIYNQDHDKAMESYRKFGGEWDENLEGESSKEEDEETLGYAHGDLNQDTAEAEEDAQEVDLEEGVEAMNNGHED